MNFSADELSLLGKYAGPETARRWETLQKKLASGGKITIANTGIYSSGKSMLFNAILDCTENERFSVGDGPTTGSADRESFTDNIDLIDMPGIGTDPADNAEVPSMLMESDIIIMTHRINAGMLNQAECEWLKKIAENIGAEAINDRLIFVCTAIDQISSEGERNKLRNELMRQVSGACFGRMIQFWEVSSTRYYKSKAEGNSELEAMSGIPALREYLVSEAERLSHMAGAMRKAEILRLCAEILSALSAARETVIRDFSELSGKIREKYRMKLEEWQGVLKTFSRKKRGDTTGLNPTGLWGNIGSFFGKEYSTKKDTLSDYKAKIVNPFLASDTLINASAMDVSEQEMDSDARGKLRYEEGYEEASSTLELRRELEIIDGLTAKFSYIESENKQ